MEEKKALLAAVAALAEIARAALERQGSLSESSGGASDNVSGILDSHTEVSEDASIMSAIKVVGMSASEFVERRKAAKLTQSQAAHALGVSHRTVSRWECGRARIDEWKAARVREMFHRGYAETAASFHERRDRWSWHADRVSSGQDGEKTGTD